MGPLYIEETIQNTHNRIAASPDPINPFEFHRLLSTMEGKLLNSIASIQENVTIYQRTPLPTLDQIKNALPTMEELQLAVRSLTNATQTLDSLNHMLSQKTHPDLSFLAPMIQTDTDHLKQQLSAIRKTLSQTITRYKLQKEFLLYKESTYINLDSPSQENHTPDQIAGYYINMTNGDLAAAKDLLLSLIEHGYAITGSLFLNQKNILAALSRLTIDTEVDLTPPKESQPLEKNDQGRGEEATTPLSPLEHQPIPTNERPPEEDHNPPLHWPQEEINQKKSHDILPTEEQKLREDSVPEKEPTPKSKVKEITFEEYNQKGYRHANLKREHIKLTKRLLEIQKEFNHDISSATKSQMTIFTQTKTAIDEIRKQLDEAEDELNQLNYDIKNGTLIRVAMKNSNKLQ